MNRRSFLAALALAPVAAKVTPAPTQADFDAFLRDAASRPPAQKYVERAFMLANGEIWFERIPRG